MKIVVAGVGRSGTTAVFSLLADSLRNSTPEEKLSFVYEPYLWRVPEVDATGHVSLGSFDNQNLSAEGIYIHTETPLFLAKHHKLHDDFVSKMVDKNDHVLIKLIRGNGRLESYLKADETLKIVGVVRNVFDTINSSLNHFCLLGDDFYRTDKYRFIKEVQEYFNEKIVDKRLDNIDDEIAWSAQWWLYMNKALIKLKKKYPKRVVLIDYDSFLKNKNQIGQHLGNFLDIDVKSYVKNNNRVGIITKQRFISGQIVNYLQPFHAFNEKVFKEDNIFISNKEFELKDIKHFINKYQYSKLPVVLRYPSKRTSVGWRYYAEGKDNQLIDNESSKIEYYTAYKKLLFSMGQTLRGDKIVDISSSKNNKLIPKVSVIVPFYNAENQLDASVMSILEQDYGNVEIVLINDCSTDNSLKIAEEWNKYTNIKLINNTRNIGPGLSRHRGVMEATGEFITTLDADDIYLPRKISSEMEVIENRKDIVVVSNVEYLHQKQSSLWRFEDFCLLNKMDQIRYILSRESFIPRDFLFSKELYYKTQGFESTVKMYEDWSFKLRISTKVKEWRSTSTLGMVYDRGIDGLSNKSTEEHIFYLLFNFLTNVDELVCIFNAEVFLLFASAIRKFNGGKLYADQIEELALFLSNKNEFVKGILRMKNECFIQAFDLSNSFDSKIHKVIKSSGYRQV